MRFLLTIFLMLLLYACETASNESESKSEPEEHPCQNTDTVDHPVKDYIPSHWKMVETRFVCYYELDDKYSDQQDSTIVKQWWNEKLTSIKTVGIQNNIFNHEGGGPNGAEWNSDADLYFVAIFKDTVDLEQTSTTIRLNTVPVVVQGYKIQNFMNATMVSFYINKSLWMSALRPVEEIDYIFLYDEETYLTPDEELAAPKNTGEMFEIEVDLIISENDVKAVVDQFHVAFGE